MDELISDRSFTVEGQNAGYVVKLLETYAVVVRRGDLDPTPAIEEWIGRSDVTKDEENQFRAVLHSTAIHVRKLMDGSPSR